MNDTKFCIACAWYRSGRPNDCIAPENSKVSLVSGEPYIPYNVSMRNIDAGCGAAGKWFKPRVAPDLPEAA